MQILATAATLFTFTTAAVAAGTTSSSSPPIARVTIETREGGFGAYKNITTVEFSIEEEFSDPSVLSAVSALYQVNEDQLFFCLAYKPDGTMYDDGHAFYYGHPLYMQEGNAPVKSISCGLE